jgi:hypothetical protein
MHFDALSGDPTGVQLRKANLADGFSVQLSNGTDSTTPWDAPSFIDGLIQRYPVPRDRAAGNIVGLTNFCGKYGWMLPWASGNMLIDAPGLSLLRAFPALPFAGGNFSWMQSTGIQGRDPQDELVHPRYREGPNSNSAVDDRTAIPDSYCTVSVAGSYLTYFYDTNVGSSQVSVAPTAGVPPIVLLDPANSGEYFPHAEQMRRKGMKTPTPRSIRSSESPDVSLLRRHDVYCAPVTTKNYTAAVTPLRTKAFSRYMRINKYVKFDSEEAFSARQQYIIMAVGPSLLVQCGFNCAWDFVDVD